MIHGLIHFLGFAKAFGLAPLPQLGSAISRPLGIVWLLAGVLSITTPIAFLFTPTWWWAIGALALVLSQVVIITSWKAARFGTLANVVLLIGVIYGFLARGPFSLPAEYDRAQALAQLPSTTLLLTEADLQHLPAPVQRSVRLSGVVGKPRVQNFRATFTGRMRASPTDPWMAFNSKQLNTLDPPRRFFLMDATMKGLPTDVLHAFDEHGATMRVRLASAVQLVNASGPVLTRGETVTLFNDLCVLAPGELVRPSIVWDTFDSHSANVRFTLGENTIAATLFFGDGGELIDFQSNDRATSPEGDPVPWTTPLRDYDVIGPARVPRNAETLWHPDGGAPWTYGEFSLKTLAYNVGP